MAGGTATAAEIASQPALWRQMAERARTDGSRVVGVGRGLVIGCGTSAFVARALAAMREDAGAGETDWAFASEAPAGRRYDHVLAVTRSGTTTEVLDALRTLPRARHTAAVVGVDGPVAETLDALVDDLIVIDEADEESVVQTRFPTSVLALARHALGVAPADLSEQAEQALLEELPDAEAFDQFVFLGRGWTVGLADEAALKLREMAMAWSESYPALDYRHGPIALAGERTLVGLLGDHPTDLVEEIAATGATILAPDLDPLAQLILAQRLGLSLAHAKGLDPDRPNRLVRSVVLDG